MSNSKCLIGPNSAVNYDNTHVHGNKRQCIMPINKRKLTNQYMYHEALKGFCRTYSGLQTKKKNEILVSPFFDYKYLYQF